MKKLLAIVIAIVFAAGCSVGGGGGKGSKKSKDEEAIKEIIDEFIEGWAEGTEKSLEEKVFVHISDDYDYAGLDYDGYVEEALENIKRRRGDVVEHSVEHDVEINGDTATDKLTVNYQTRNDADLDVSFEITGEASGKSVATLKKEDGEWKITSVETLDGASSGGGAADGVAAPTIENLTITPNDSIAPGEEVQISGQVVFPEKQADDLAASLEIGLQWDYKRPNAKWRGSFNDIAFTDEPDPAGTYDFSITLPADGDPEAEIPEVFPAGADAVSINVTVLFAERTGGEEKAEEYQVLALVGQSEVIELKDFENEMSECEDEPLDETSPEGIWQTDVVGPGELAFFSMIDLMSTGDSSCVLVTLPGLGDNEPMHVPACGSVTDDTFVGHEEWTEDCPGGDPRQFDIELTFDGLDVSGTMQFSGCGEPTIGLALAGEKVSNRCEFLWHPDVADGVWESVEGEGTAILELTYTGSQKFEVTLETDDNTFEGLVGKAFGNVIEVYPGYDVDKQFAQVAFDSADSATIFLYDHGALIQTSHLIRAEGAN